MLSVLRNMKLWAAPGYDGYQAGFFVRFWDTFNDTLFQLVKTALETGFVPQDLNVTLVSLILKVEVPKSISRF